MDDQRSPIHMQSDLPCQSLHYGFQGGGVHADGKVFAAIHIHGGTRGGLAVEARQLQDAVRMDIQTN